MLTTITVPHVARPTFHAGVVRIQVRLQVGRARLVRLQFCLEVRDFAATPGGTFCRDDARDVRLAADVAVVLLDATAGAHASVLGRLDVDDFVGRAAFRLEYVGETVLFSVWKYRKTPSR